MTCDQFMQASVTMPDQQTDDLLEAGARHCSECPRCRLWLQQMFALAQIVLPPARVRANYDLGVARAEELKRKKRLESN
jgi:hypothetical protein